MTPTIVTKDGRLVLLTGSPGGRTIINTVFAIVLGVVEYGMNGRQAVDARPLSSSVAAGPGRRSRRKRCLTRCSNGCAAWATMSRAQGRQGDAHSIWMAPDGMAYGVEDRRTPDSKASVPAAFDTDCGRTVGCTEHVSRLRAPWTPAPPFAPLRRAGRSLRDIAPVRNARRLHRASPDNGEAFLLLWTLQSSIYELSKLDGLIPAVIQDDVSNEVLMVGFMNQEALDRTVATGFATFFSRTRGKLWTKGETSGNRLKVERILVDCDEDTVLVRVTRLGDGNVCHTGDRSCFSRAYTG